MCLDILKMYSLINEYQNYTDTDTIASNIDVEDRDQMRMGPGNSMPLIRPNLRADAELV